MKRIILNERRYAEEILRNTIVEEKPHETLPLLARYYYSALGYRKKMITWELRKYMIQRFPEYSHDKASWDLYIERLATKAGFFTLREIDGVWITQAEMDAIDALGKQPMQKVAFTYLCLAKLGNIQNPGNDNWVKRMPREVFQYARVIRNRGERGVMLSHLRNVGLISFAKRNTNLSCRVEFIDESSKEILFVNDFRELGYEYLFYKGKDYFRCGECGVLSKKTDFNKGLYCKDCMTAASLGYKQKRCIDCGTEFLVKNRSRSTRCPECQELYRKQYRAHWYRDNIAQVASGDG